MLSSTGRGLRGYWVHALTSSREIYNTITALCHWWCEKGYELGIKKECDYLSALEGKSFVSDIVSQPQYFGDGGMTVKL